MALPTFSADLTGKTTTDDGDSKNLTLANRLLGNATFVDVKDKYRVSIANKVFIGMEGRNSLVFTPAGDISLKTKTNFNSGWDSLSDVNWIGLAGNVLNMGYGLSLRQPWMGRPAYQGTDPLSISIPIELYGITNAYTEVYRKIVNFLTYFYPITDDTSDSLVKMFKIPGPSSWGKFSTENGKSSNKATPAKVLIGKFMYLSECYFTNCSIKVSPKFTTQGFPIWAKAELEVKASEMFYLTGNEVLWDVGNQYKTPAIPKHYPFLSDFVTEETNNTAMTAKRNQQMGAFSNSPAVNTDPQAQRTADYIKGSVNNNFKGQVPYGSSQ